jgi:hypothetical protein
MSLQRRSGLVTGPEHTLAKDLDFDRLLYSDFTLVIYFYFLTILIEILIIINIKALVKLNRPIKTLGEL